MVKARFVEPPRRPLSTSAKLLKYHWKLIGNVPETVGLKIALLLMATEMFVGCTSKFGGVRWFRWSTRLPASEL